MVHFPWMPQARATARLATRVAHLYPGQLRFKAAGECILQVKRRLKSPAPNFWIHRICSTQCFRMESASFVRRQNHSALKFVQSRHITTILFSELLKWLCPFGLVCSLEDHLDTWFNGGTPKIDTCLSTSPIRFLPTSSSQCPKIPYRSCCLRWMAMDGDGCDGGGIWFETEVFEAPGSDELCPVLKNRMLRFGAKEAWPPWLMEQRKWTNRMSLGARPLHSCFGSGSLLRLHLCSR